jgi:hypothetical protein
MDYGHPLEFGSFIHPTSSAPQQAVDLASLAEGRGRRTSHAYLSGPGRGRPMAHAAFRRESRRRGRAGTSFAVRRR